MDRCNSEDLREKEVVNICDGRRLGCESCTIAFTDVTEKNEYIKRFCCTYEYEKCPHAQRLLEKYRS